MRSGALSLRARISSAGSTRAGSSSGEIHTAADFGCESKFSETCGALTHGASTMRRWFPVLSTFEIGPKPVQDDARGTPRRHQL